MLAEKVLNLFDEAYDSPDEPELPSYLYQSLPVFLLLGGGYVFAGRMLRDGKTDVSPAVSGASITAGYLLAVVVGVYLFSWSTTVDGMTVSYEPILSDAILFAGTLYPIVFGGIGGYLAGRSH